MSDFDTSPGPRDRQAATPTATAQRHSRLSSRVSGLLQALWARKPRTQTQGQSPGQFGIQIWSWIVLGILFCLPVAGMILGYFTSPPVGTKSIASGGAFSEASSESPKIPKPAPGRPMGSSSQAPPPSITSPAASPIEPISPPQIAVPQRPVSPTITPTPQPPIAAPPPSAPAPGRAPFAAMTYPARHDKHFGGECSGQLTLNSSGLVFSCPEDAGSGFQFAINQIESVDDNGIRLTSGKKYHFTIPGMNKDSERALFADWLSRVR